jgi:hypothetical protein
LSERRSIRGWIWGLLAAAALLWPARVSGPFDGVPLDGVAEAVLIGVVVPALWCFHPRFLRTRLARACVVALLAWKAFTAAVLVQDGLCLRFMTAEPFARDATGAPHSWDVRADWRSPDPSCSAIVARPYNQFSEFPAWFFNLPPPNDSWPGPLDRPPGAIVAMTVSGFLHTAVPGSLRILTGPGVAAVVHVDEGVAPGDKAPGDVMLTPGVHRILIDARLTGDRWRFVPLWNGADLWPQSIATLKKPSRLDLAFRPWGTWVVSALVVALALAWVASAIRRIRDVDVLTWAAGAAAWIGLVTVLGHEELARWSIVALAGAALLRVPARLRNIFGAFLLIGIPWLTLVVVSSAPQVGRFRLYSVGDDFWMFQRYAYRIVMQGYWLEGGSRTFWFQPFYRWIVALLHLVFGDSSVGESYWDGACLVAMALFAFHVTKVFAGFRWGIVAAVTTLAVFALGTWRFLGLGLSEISSAGLLYLAALLVMSSRHGNWRAAIAAGVLATLAFYTRLNNLPMAFAVAVFALPVRMPARIAFRLPVWLPRTAWLTVAAVCGTLCAGLLFFTWRTWHYTGVLDPFYGTQRSRQAVWTPGMSLQAYSSSIVSSVLLTLTMNDSGRFDVHATTLLAGTAVSLLAVAGVPRLRNLPLGPVLFCLAGISGSLVARGGAYPGRFSIHLIGVTSAVVACTAALLCRMPFTRSTSPSS